MAVSQTDYEEAQAAIEQMAEDFETLNCIIRSASHHTQSAAFNPETLGPISAFLGCGNGWEAAHPGYQFVDSEKLLALLGDEIDEEEDEEEDENDEVEEEENFSNKGN